MIRSAVVQVLSHATALALASRRSPSRLVLLRRLSSRVGRILQTGPFALARCRKATASVALLRSLGFVGPRFQVGFRGFRRASPSAGRPLPDLHKIDSSPRAVESTSDPKTSFVGPRLLYGFRGFRRASPWEVPLFSNLALATTCLLRRWAHATTTILIHLSWRDLTGPRPPLSWSPRAAAVRAMSRHFGGIGGVVPELHSIVLSNLA